VSVRVRIKQTPREKQLDGMPLDNLVAGRVREVSATLAAWLIAQGYAEPEMRRSTDDEYDFTDAIKPVRATAHDRRRPRRRATDR
jgi:hypothetical protein